MDSTELIKKFTEFLELNYLAELLERKRKGKNHLIIDYKKLIRFEPELADQLFDDPEEALKAFSISAERVVQDLHEDFAIRIKNSEKISKIQINKIRSKDVGKWVTIEGMIKKKSDVKGQITIAKFECPACANEISVLQLDDREFKKPGKCSCGRRIGFHMTARTEIDIFSMSIEEPHESISGGTKLSQLKILCRTGLTLPKVERMLYQGVRVEISGILKEYQLMGPKGTLTPKVDWYLEANYIKIHDESFINIKWNKEDILDFEKLAKKHDWLVDLRQSIFYDIHGYVEECEGIILQLFSGVGKTREGAKVRGNFHILLVGDPGSSKSTMLKIAEKFAPKAMYVAGTGITGVGLTATAVRDELLGGFTLEAGALVLCNNGLLCIDELDKVNDEFKKALHEPLSEECYHPDTEIIIDGRRVSIGEYVDGVLSKEDLLKEEVKKEHCAEVIGFCGGVVSNTKTDYVYRKKHSLPLYRIVFTNGREIMCTGSHPVFVFDASKKYFLNTMNASQLTGSEYVPVVPQLPIFGAVNVLKVMPKTGNKDFKFPKKMTCDLALFLGFFAAEGHVYHGKHNNSYEIGVSTTCEKQKYKYVKLIEELFGISPNINISKKDDNVLRKRDKYTIRILGKDFYHFFLNNFPELSKKCQIKRAPSQVFTHYDFAKNFLYGAFEGDGCFVTKQYNITTSSKKLAQDYQDLLLLLGAHSTITITHTDNVNWTNTYYCVNVCGNSATVFANLFGVSEKNKCNKIIPYAIYPLLRKLMIQTGFANRGDLHRRGKSGIGLPLVRNKLRQIYQKDIGVKQYVDTLSHFLDSVDWIRIKSINEIKDHPGYVYDVNIPNGNTFISQGGLLLHNTVSVAKANIQATLVAATSVLAAANPKHGSYSDYDTVYSQIDLSPTLINRFDLVYPIKESKLNADDDYKIAMKILGRASSDEKKLPTYSREFVTKYISYARTITPFMSPKIQQFIANKYAQLKELKRKSMGEGKQSIPITGRNVDGFRRIIEAVARSRLHTTITEDDAERGYFKVIYSLEQVGIDPTSGDTIEAFSVGKPMRKKDLLARTLAIIRDQTIDNRGDIEHEEITAILQSEGIEDEMKIDETIALLKRNGDIFEPRAGRYQVVR